VHLLVDYNKVVTVNARSIKIIQQNLPKTELDRNGIFFPFSQVSVFTGFRFTKGSVLTKQSAKNIIA
jgi:hypothetical protein